MVNNNLFTEMLVTYNSILIITALLPNLNATAPKNLLWKLEQRCSICADTVLHFFSLGLKKILAYWFVHYSLNIGSSKLTLKFPVPPFESLISLAKLFNGSLQCKFIWTSFISIITLQNLYECQARSMTPKDWIFKS